MSPPAFCPRTTASAKMQAGRVIRYIFCGPKGLQKDAASTPHARCRSENGTAYRFWHSSLKKQTISCPNLSLMPPIAKYWIRNQVKRTYTSCFIYKITPICFGSLNSILRPFPCITFRSITGKALRRKGLGHNFKDSGFHSIYPLTPEKIREPDKRYFDPVVRTFPISIFKVKSALNPTLKEQSVL